MKYLLDLFTPETWRAFQENGATVTGFRERHSQLAHERVRGGDVFLCYLTQVSRWCGVLEVESEAYSDDRPIFENPDPFTVRFKVKPVVMLEPSLAVPIYDDRVWNTLTVTKPYEKRTRSWTGFFRGSLNRFEKADGEYLVQLLKEQQSNPEKYPLSEKDKRTLAGRKKVPTLDREVEVEVPDDEEDEPVLDPAVAQPTGTLENRDSIRYQAKVAQVGAEMGFRIWVPRNDKRRVLELIPTQMHENFLELLPLNYDDTTLRTVEQIDVLWLKGRSMARAFEIEHTTSIYSGLLRMADLLALQPNMDIRLHIVAPPDKREKVLREIRRPVFSLLERGPLYEQCSFLSYESVDKLADERHLSHMIDTIIGVYEESTEV